MKINSNPLVIDLFAGAGGLSLGASRAGFEVSCAVEIDKFALETHATNFPKSMHLPLDISTLDGKALLSSVNLKKGKIDGLIGGPPCQGFSVIGRRSPTDLRNNLFVNFFRLVKEIRPRFFLAENVPGILNSRYDELRQDAFSLIQNDYELLSPLIIPANEYGAPTTRTRVFFIGYDPKRYPKSLQLEDFRELIVSDEERIRVQRALYGLPINIDSKLFKPESAKLEINFMDYAVKDSFEELISGKIPREVGAPNAIRDYLEFQKISGCLPTIHAPEIRERYRKLKYGQEDPVSRSVKLDPNGFCPTLRAGTGPEKGSFQAVRPIHYSEPRVISPREAARLQGFPDWFVFHNTKWHSFRQIGNSVSPIVAEKLLHVIVQKMT